MANGMTMTILNERGNDPKLQQQGTINLFNLNAQTVGGDLDVSVLARNMGLGDDKAGGAKAGLDFGGDDGSEEEGEGLFDGAGDEKQENALDTGIIINFDDIEEIMVSKKHKKLETAERNVKIEIKQDELKEYMKKMVKMPETEKKKKDTIKVHMIDIRDAMEYLQ